MYSPVSFQEAVSIVKSNDRVFVHSAAMAANELLHALVERADELRNVEITHLHIDGDAPHTQTKYRDI